MAVRRRTEQEYEATKSDLGRQIVTLEALTGGYNGWISPDILSPQFWAGASNVYSGQFGTIRRARWAPIQNAASLVPSANGSRISTMFGYFPTGATNPWLICDNTNSVAPNVYNTPFMAKVNASGIHNFDQILVGLTAGPQFFGPYMRITPIPAMVLQANGLIRTKIYLSGGIQFWLEFWGLDAPDSSAQITLVAGSTATISAAPTGAVRTSNVATITTTAPHGLITGQYVGISGVTDTSFNTATGVAVQITVTGGSTFTYANIGPNTTSGSGTVTLGITKTVGRSYQWAWENANTAHVSAPAPASQYVKYASQIGTIDCIQPGTISTSIGSPNVTGVNTKFTSAWIGRTLWVEGQGFFGSGGGVGVQSVTDATHLVMNGNASSNIAGGRFQVMDFQATHIRLYATGDGGSVYFLIARNAFNNALGGVASAGLEFSDTANSEPPNPPFSSEITQNFNVPPPIGKFVDQYQGRPIVYGVSGAPQSFFYGNIETTVVGQPPESFAPLNQVTLPVGDGQLNGSANLPTGFILWSNHQDMFKLTGLLSDNTVSNQFQLGATIQRLPYKIGCASPYATAITSLGAFWLSSDRQVWLFTDHYAPKNVGVPIQDILNRINGSRMAFAKMKVYKSNDRNWLALAVALDSSTFNNKLCLLDLDLLASNGQPSFFTFDMATNAPSWYLYDVNCESIEQAIDSNSVQHLLAGDVDLITDLDWQPAYYTISAEQSVTGNNTLHAVGNENPEIVKTVNWMRAMTNQLPLNLAAQGWNWNILTFDDDTSVIGVTTVGNVVQLIPGQNNPSGILGLEYSPAKFVFGARPAVKGRRFQIKTNFPSTPGFYELRGFQFAYQNEVAR
jgi:hypothetical protein